MWGKHPIRLTLEPHAIAHDEIPTSPRREPGDPRASTRGFSGTPRVAPLIADRGLGAVLGCGEHRLGCAPPGEELKNLAHRHAGIVAHRQEGRPRGLRTLLAGHASEVPGHVFDVGGIRAAMRLKLPTAVGEPAGAIERDPPLPELRLEGRAGGHDPVKRLR